MDSSEVIIDKLSNNTASVERILITEEDNGISVITQNSSPTSKKEDHTNVKPTLINSCRLSPSENINDCEIMLVIENSRNKAELVNGSNATQCEGDIPNSGGSEKKDENNVLVCNTGKQSITENIEKIECSILENTGKLQIDADNKVSSLSSIALEYGSSDSDAEDSSCNVNIKENESASAMDIQILSYRLNKPLSSSSDESDSEEDSSSSSDSSITVESDDSDDDSGAKRKTDKNVKNQKTKQIKNELDDLPPIEDLKISVPEVLCDPLGKVAWMVDQLVVVQPISGKPTLNLDTVLFIEKGSRTLGKIFDVFGQVGEPHYCVRFNSTDHIQECDIKLGMTVYYCPNTEYTSLVFLHELMKMKGSDGVGEDEPPEFSDDEEERAYYEKLKQTQANNKNNADTPLKRRRTTSPSTGWQTNHPWNRNRINGQYTQRDTGTVSTTTNDGQSHNAWSQIPYQNRWPPRPRYMYPPEQYGYGQYPPGLQSMPYACTYVNSGDQNFQHLQHNYLAEDSLVAPLSPRIPFNARPRFPPGFAPYGQHRPGFSPNPRFRYPDMTWQSRMSSMPARMSAPWVSLPPPPPPPPPSSSDTS